MEYKKEARQKKVDVYKHNEEQVKEWVKLLCKKLLTAKKGLLDAYYRFIREYIPQELRDSALVAGCFAELENDKQEKEKEFHLMLMYMVYFRMIVLQKMNNMFDNNENI